MSFNEFGFTRASTAYHPDTGEEIPVDTPIYVDFAAGKKGSLMEEGTENLNSDPFFKTGVSGWRVGTWTTLEWLSSEYNPFSKQNGVMRLYDNDGGTGLCSKVVSISDTPHTVSVLLKILKGNINSINVGGTIFYTDRTNTDYTWNNSNTTRYDMSAIFGQGVYKLVATITPDSSKTISSYQIRISHNDRVETELLVYAVQLEAKPYATSFIDGTRANPRKWITLPEALPDTFAIGISAKMLHAHDTADRTFWECGGYRCYYDVTARKLKMTNGTVTAEIPATWNADDYVGVYAGRDNATGKLFIQAKIAGVTGDKAEVTGDAVDSGTTLYVGSRTDGSESSNAVFADFVLHDRPEDIDPIGYLSQIGKPKVTAVVGEEVESIPGSQLRDGLFREIPRVFSKPVAVSIAPGVFYQKVDLGNWAAGLRVYASEDMVMFIAGREIEIPKSVLLYLPWKVRTFEVRRKSAAAVGTLYMYGGC